MDPCRHPSDLSSHYSASTTGSIWSTTGSVSFVYTDDPDWAWWGYEGVRGAVTRKEDRRDDRRIRVAAHILRGPFAGLKSKKHHHHHHHSSNSSSGGGGGSSHHHHHHRRRRDSDARSDYSSSSGYSSASSRGGGGPRDDFSRGPSPVPMPPVSPQHCPGQQHPQRFDNFPHGGPPMGMGGPPPPPAMAGPPPQPGFEAGFIQLGGGGGGGGRPSGPPQDPVWGHDAQYGGEPEVWD